MKNNPKNKRIAKTPQPSPTSDPLAPIIRAIGIQFPSLGTDEARTCAQKAYREASRKARNAAATAQLCRKVVSSFAYEFVTESGGSTFVMGRADAMAQVLLGMWAVPNNDLEIERFVKMLNRGRVAYGKAEKFLGVSAEQLRKEAKQ